MQRRIGERRRKGKREEVEEEEKKDKVEKLNNRRRRRSIVTGNEVIRKRNIEKEKIEKKEKAISSFWVSFSPSSSLSSSS